MSVINFLILIMKKLIFYEILYHSINHVSVVIKLYDLIYDKFRMRII